MRAEVEPDRGNGGRLVGELDLGGRERHSFIGVPEPVGLIGRGAGAGRSDLHRGAGQPR
jgi:hypothetical protein